MEPSRLTITARAYGRIGNFHIFKWRLAMSLHGTLNEGVKPDDIYSHLINSDIDQDNLSLQLGWDKEVIDTINVYRGFNTRYTFPTPSEIRDHLNRYFIESNIVFPDYELGECCPTISNNEMLMIIPAKTRHFLIP
jgi:hypothetical protein